VGDNEHEIRDLIHKWVAAVHAGDLETVLADHTEDIVMFDVPPPNEGVRGLDAYSRTWPHSSSGSDRGRRSRSSRSTSLQAKTSPSHGPYSVVEPRTTSERIPTIACG
jgi:hypothetical protein